MSKNKLIIIMIVLIIIIVVIIRSFISSNNTSEKPVLNKTGYEDVVTKKDEEKVANIDSKYKSNVLNKHYLGLDEDGRKLIDDKIDMVLSLINTRKTRELYDLMSKDYRLAKFPKYDLFADYFINEFPNSNYECQNYYLASSANMIVNLIGDNNFNFPIKVIYYNAPLTDTEIMFDTLNSIEKASFLVTDDENVLYKIYGDYFFRYDEKFSAMIRIHNSSDHTVNFDFTGSQLTSKQAYITKYSNLIEGSNTKVSVGANQDAYFELDFEHPFSLPKTIIFKYNYEGENYEKWSGIAYELEIED